MRKLALLFFFFGLNQSPVWSQESTQKDVTYTLSAAAIHATLFAHSKSIAKYKGVIGAGIQIDLNRYRKDALAYQYGHRHFNSGFGFQYVKFSSPDLGEAANLFYFLEPFLIERRKVSFRLKAAGGINYGSNPYDKQTNPDNDAYSAHINGYLGLGMSLNFTLTPKLQMMLSGTYSHFSNGNTNNPNSGMNYPNIGAGLEYNLASKNKPLGKQLFYAEPWRFDVAFFLCNKSLPYFPDMRFWTFGAYTQASYQVHPIHAFTLGMEAYVDQSMRMAMDKSNIYYDKNLDNKLLGLLIGHEFLFNRMIFSQQLGVYLYKEVPGELINLVYHRWGINYKLNRRFMLGINLNSNLQKAFIFDGRISYSMYR
ncbi:MAG: acyloxyacyl hydrolase [bacterium]|nr:acyloxyacyl hydrolase [bacterium]